MEAATSQSAVCWHGVNVGGAVAANNSCGDNAPNGNSCLCENVLEVSNPLVPLPLRDISVLSNFLNAGQVKRLVNELAARQDKEATWEGFDGPRRRVQGYDFDSDNDVPETLLEVRQRLKDLMGLTATGVKLEEYTPVFHKMAGRAYNPTINSTFPRKTKQQPCSCQRGVEKVDDSINKDTVRDAEDPSPSCCSCFVAEIPLIVSDSDTAAVTDTFVQNWNQPASRQAVCWHLRSDQHWTDVRLSPNAAIVKRGDMLTEWRSTHVLSTFATTDTTTVRVLKLYSLASEEEGSDNGITDKDDTFGYVPSPKDEIKRRRRLQEPMPPLSDLLTIIITTSPIKSNPSTELLELAMKTFDMGGHDFAYRCRKVIVCDGFRMQDADDDDDSPEDAEEASGNTIGKNMTRKVSRKHSNVKQAMRNGIVTCEQADNYRQFKQNLRKLCVEASCSETKSVFCNAKVVELEERYGYGFALRHAVRHCIDTPFVCVIQHDRTFMRPTPVLQTVKAMWLHTNIKYVGFSMRSNLLYRDIFVAKYGRREAEEWHDMVLHVPELLVPASSYGPGSASSKAMVSISGDKLRKNILSLAETYKGSAQAATSKQPTVGSDDDDDDGDTPARHQMTLTPTLFWYDNVHICDTNHYRDFVFHKSYKMVARGGFVEDKLSPVLKRTVERLGLREGHARFGCYLLDDHSGMFFTGHLDGGNYITAEERKELISSQKR